MARCLRSSLPDGLFHLTSRGTGRRRIFLDRHDYERFLRFLTTVTVDHGWEVMAYCLMPNHHHLSVKASVTQLAEAMERLNGRYAQCFNQRHGRSGHVFQGRYSSRVIDDAPHLLEAWRYVALNPVRAGLCKSPGEWEWSSHAAIIGRRPAPPFLSRAVVLQEFGGDPASYASFVAEGMTSP
jgi:putative transposase